MSTHTHIVKRLVIDLELVEPGTEGVALQGMVSEICREKVVPAMERLFGQLSGDGEVFTIDRLELDLGSISPDRLEGDLPGMVEEALFRELGDRIATARADYRRRGEYGAAAGDPDVLLSTRADSQIRAVSWFLKTGQLPWNTSSTFSEIFGEVLAGPREVVAAVLQEELQHAVQRERFISQCPDEMVVEALTACVDSRVFRRVNRESFKQLLHLVPGLVTALFEPGALPWTRSRIRREVWAQILDALFPTVRPASAPDTEWLQRTVREVIEGSLGRAGGSSADTEARLNRLLRSVRRSGAGGSGVDRDLRRMIAGAVQDLLLEIERSRLDSLSVDPGSDGRDTEGGAGSEEEGAGSEDKTDKHGSSSEADKRSGGDTSADSPEEIGKTGRSDRQAGSPGKAAPLSGEPVARWDGRSGFTKDNLQRSSGEKDQRKGPGKEVQSVLAGQAAERSGPAPLVKDGFARNAGLVILHPFLPHFFTQLGLAEKRQFVSDESKQRAVHLLQWLAAGKLETPEEELLLNKLMCGLEPEFPVPSGIEIISAEMEECKNLMSHVLHLWRALKSSSPEAIRTTFLQRDGLIGREGFSGGWKVTVERNTFDVLLDQLPWGISMIKLPWNPWLIHVEW